MNEALQRFSAPSSAGISGLVTGLLLFWLLWPVVCAALGMRRGQGTSGFLHGLFWGPLGLLPVLLAKPKHRCPTCGKMTLAAPVPAVPVAPPVHPAALRPKAEWIEDVGAAIANLDSQPSEHKASATEPAA